MTALLNAAPARPLSEDLAALIDILVVNAVEAEMLGGGAVTDLDAAASAARHLEQSGNAVIVTAGGDGLAIRSKGFNATAAAQKVELIGTHGAGDAFIGALAACLSRDDTLKAASTYANAAAATPCSRRPKP